jgi:hypothetical protein
MDGLYVTRVNPHAIAVNSQIYVHQQIIKTRKVAPRRGATLRVLVCNYLCLATQNKNLALPSFY